MLGPPKLRGLDHRPLGVSVGDLVAPDNFYRFLEAKLVLSIFFEPDGAAASAR